MRSRRSLPGCSAGSHHHDVLTYEFENVDAGAIDEVRGITATPQGTDLLRVTQHRVREKQFINDHGTATAPWRAVNNFDELDAALWMAVLSSYSAVIWKSAT